MEAKGLILAVTQDAEIADNLTSYFTQQNYDVRVADNEDTALATIQEQSLQSLSLILIWLD